METNSQNPSSRPRGTRSRNRNRNRQGRSPKGGQSGGRNGDRNRNRNGERSRRQPKQTAFQKFLSAITFGLLGKPKAKSRPKPARSESPKSDRPSRKPVGSRQAGEPSKETKRNRSEVTSNRLYVGNLDYSTGEAELEELFNGVGNVLSAEVVTNPRTQQSKGFAFVEMGSVEEAKRAVGILDEQEFMGRKLIVSGARSEGPGEEGDEPALAESGSSDARI